MKKVLIILSLLISSGVYAQSDKYTAAMQKNLLLFDSAKTSQDYQVSSDAFARIGDAEKTQWQPYYYAGLALSQIGWMDPKLDKDANSTKINAYCDKAESIEKNSEILALRNMSYTQEMMVDPQNRWMTFGKQAGEALTEGMKMDPNNPRLYYLQGMSLFNTPEAFGGGKSKAKPLFEKAIALFKTYPVKPLNPSWGLQKATLMLAKCQ